MSVSLFYLPGCSSRYRQVADRDFVSQVQGLGVLGGIGFTASLFITGLAFNDPALIDLSKIGIFAASIVVA
ncbi:MAG: Na+/H+ antiporter NhaA [Acidobacteria bacterium]|nr:Na+/H+ antiporter NhaA [Acidobacteriota bacterium]